MNLSLRNQRGIGLLELMLSLAIIAILLIMATRYFTAANTNQQVNNAVDMFSGVRASVNSYYTDNGAGAAMPNISTLVTSGYLPQSYGGSGGSGTTANPWGGSIATASASSAGHFTVSMAGVPSSACTMLNNRLTQTVNTSTSSGESVSACSGGSITVTYSR